MGRQPAPRKIIEKKPSINKKIFTTLLVDGSNLLEVCSLGDRTLSANGEQIGGIFQFFLQLKMMLQKGNFRFVYVFWDGERSGQLRYNLYKDYKANRDKEYMADSLSDYGRRLEERIYGMQTYFNSKKDSLKNSTEKENQKKIFYEQRDVVMDCLDELFVRQCVYDETEADDFIGYYVSHKLENERIVILSNDADLSQLISEDVIVYSQRMKRFITIKNFTEIFGYDYRNVLLQKMICGDVSDNIKGIKGIGLTTILKKIPRFSNKYVTLEEIKESANRAIENSENKGKKPPQWAYNIVNGVTGGTYDGDVYEINRKIMDLKNPLMSSGAKKLIESMMYAPLDPEGRSLENLYKIILDKGIDKLKDEKAFGNFFNEFMNLVNLEKKNLPV